MIRCKMLVVAALASLFLVSGALAQADGGPGAGGRAPGGMMGRMMMGGMFGRNALDNYVAALADVNLSPDFTLTVDQKKQIKDIRDDFKKTADDFNATNKDELVKARQAMRDARGDRTAMQAARKQIQDVMNKGPKADDYVAKIKALLTQDQSAQVDKKVEELRPQRPNFGGGGRGGRGGGGNGGGGGANGA